MMEEPSAEAALALILPSLWQMDRWIEKGHGKDGWTVIAKDVSLSRPSTGAGWRATAIGTSA